MGGRSGALVALAALGAVLVATLALSTPWHPLADPPSPRTPVAAERDFTAEERAREVDFHAQLRPWTYAGMAVGLLVLLALGLTPLGARLVELVARPLGGGWPARAGAGMVGVLAVGRLAGVPTDLRREVVLRRFGLSTQSWGSWTLDQAKGFAVGAVVSAVAAVLLYALARRFPQTWWAWAGLAGAALTVALSFAYPLVVEPIFNRFTPLPAGELRDSLVALAEGDGIAVDEVLVADASRRTTALNAYVSGIGRTRRIVVYDTLLERATDDEVRLVVAHELGHVAEHDVRDGTLIAALGVVAATAGLYLALTSAGLLRRAGIESAEDPRGVALVAMLAGLATLVSAPVANLVSRRVEARADVHALDLTRDAQTFVEGERRLGITNLSDLDPHPLAYWLFYTHPSTPERIALGRDWARREGLEIPGDLVPSAAPGHP